MFCQKCGHRIQDGMKFCSNCGASVDENQNVTFRVDYSDDDSKKTTAEKIGNVVGFIVLIFIITLITVNK